MRHCCRNCHYLAYTYVSTGQIIGIFTDIWSQDQRDSVSLPDDADPCCYRQVWDSTNELKLSKNLHEVINKRRRNKCYFWPYKERFSFEEGIAAQERESKIRQEIKSHWFKVIGLVIAASGVLIAALHLL